MTTHQGEVDPDGTTEIASSEANGVQKTRVVRSKSRNGARPVGACLKVYKLRHLKACRATRKLKTRDASNEEE